jgi:hypothetical protein
MKLFESYLNPNRLEVYYRFDFRLTLIVLTNYSALINAKSRMISHHRHHHYHHHPFIESDGDGLNDSERG